MPHRDAEPSSVQSFEQEQRRVLVLIQESRAVIDSICAAHLSGRFELLYPCGDSIGHELRPPEWTCGAVGNSSDVTARLHADSTADCSQNFKFGNDGSNVCSNAIDTGQPKDYPKVHGSNMSMGVRVPGTQGTHSVSAVHGMPEKSHSRSSSRTGRSGILKILAAPPDVLQCNVEAQTVLGNILCTKLLECAAHMDRLHARVCDKTSKVLVTGDVNSGKSTFVNALLGVSLLPMDQQPCTQSFCEIVPVMPRSPHAYAVHAIPNIDAYSIDNRSTYSVMTQETMHDLVQDELTEYQVFRVFLPFDESHSATHDPRGAHEVFFDCAGPHPADLGNSADSLALSCKSPLFRNSHLDLSIIDSPGLNSDLFKTLSLYSKQDDIDVIVFLVNAANHLTLSAREFLEAASKEKALVFVLVNKFDEIRNRDKCTRLVLGQIQDVLPQTYAHRDRLVHFVSSSHVLQARAGDACGSGAADEFCASFGRLEDALVNFIIQRRMNAKLDPAQTYVLNVLHEAESVLAHTQRCRADALAGVEHELSVIAPCYDELSMHRAGLVADLAEAVERRAQAVHAECVLRLAAVSPERVVASVPWRGVASVVRFWDEANAAVQEAYGRAWSDALGAAAALVGAGQQELYAAACTHARSVFEVREDRVGGLSAAAGDSIGAPGVRDCGYGDAAPDAPGGEEGTRGALFSAGPDVVPLRLDVGALLWTAADILGMHVRRALALVSGAAAAVSAVTHTSPVSVCLRLLAWRGADARHAAAALVLGAVCGGAVLSAVAVVRRLEHASRERLWRHYGSQTQSTQWTQAPAQRVADAAARTLGSTRERLVSRFDAALGRQRELRAQKSVEHAQLSEAVRFLCGRRAAIRQLVRSCDAHAASAAGPNRRA